MIFLLFSEINYSFSVFSHPFGMEEQPSSVRDPLLEESEDYIMELPENDDLRYPYGSDTLLEGMEWIDDDRSVEHGLYSR